MNELTFPGVKSDQAELVSKLAGEIWPQVYSDMISAGQIEYMLKWMYEPEHIRLEIIEQGVTYQFIQLNEERVGFFAFGSPNQNGTTFIHKIYVSPLHHRKGFGSAALKTIENQAARQGGKSMELRVNRSNEKAIRLYQKTGFKIISEDCAEIGGGFVMDDYVLEKRL